MDITDIRKHWSGVEGGHRKLSFSDAKAHMDFMLNEHARLNKELKKHKRIESRLEADRLMMKNNHNEMIIEMHRVVEAYK